MKFIFALATLQTGRFLSSYLRLHDKLPFIDLSVPYFNFVNCSEEQVFLQTRSNAKRLEVKAASGKKYNFSQIFGPELRRVVR